MYTSIDRYLARAEVISVLRNHSEQKIIATSMGASGVRHHHCGHVGLHDERRILKTPYTQMQKAHDDRVVVMQDYEDYGQKPCLPSTLGPMLPTY